MEHTIFNIFVQNPQTEVLLTIIHLVEALIYLFIYFFVSVNVWKEDYHPNSFSVIRWKKKNIDREKGNPRGRFSKSNIEMQRARQSRDSRGLAGEGPGEGLR